MKSDMLKSMFFRQQECMEMLRLRDILPEYPIDLKTKPGQRLIKENIFNTVEELCEASFTLKNRVHRVTDADALDFKHYVEELGDAMAYFMEVCILSGISADQLFDEYCRKNAIVKKRLEDGY